MTSSACARGRVRAARGALRAEATPPRDTWTCPTQKARGLWPCRAELREGCAKELAATGHVPPPEGICDVSRVAARRLLHRGRSTFPRWRSSHARTCTGLSILLACGDATARCARGAERRAPSARSSGEAAGTLRRCSMGAGYCAGLAAYQGWIRRMDGGSEAHSQPHTPTRAAVPFVPFQDNCSEASWTRCRGETRSSCGAGACERRRARRRGGGRACGRARGRGSARVAWRVGRRRGGRGGASPAASGRGARAHAKP